MFDFEEEQSKIIVLLSIDGHDKTYSLRSEYLDDVAWYEILDDMVKTLEASYGYSFNISPEIGMYYPGKQDDSE